MKIEHILYSALVHFIMKIQSTSKRLVLRCINLFFVPSRSQYPDKKFTWKLHQFLFLCDFYIFEFRESNIRCYQECRYGDLFVQEALIISAHCFFNKIRICKQYLSQLNCVIIVSWSKHTCAYTYAQAHAAKINEISHAYKRLKRVQANCMSMT